MNLRACKRQRLSVCVAIGLMGAVAAPGVFAQQLHVSDGTTQTASGTYATTADDVAGRALWAENAGSRIDGANITATTSGGNAFGVSAYSGGRVELTDSTVATSGDGSFGLVAYNFGSVTMRGGTVTTTGTLGATGVFADDDSNFTLADTAILARGVDSRAMQLRNRGVVSITGGSATAELSHAVEAYSNASLTANGTTFESLAGDAIRGFTGADVTLVGGRVVSTGAGGRGVALTDAGTTLSASGGTSFETTNGTGIDLRAGASAVLDGARIQSGATGVAITDAGTSFEATNSTIDASRGTGLRIDQGAAATLTNTSIAASDHAITLDGIDTGSAVVISGGTLDAGLSTISAQSGIHTLTLSGGTQLKGGANALVEVLDNAVLATTIDGSDLVGDLGATALGVLDVAFRNGASLTGGLIEVGNVDVGAGTTWTVDKNSFVETLLHTGNIAFAELPQGTTAPTAFRTLTVQGNYTGDGGLLHLNASLDGDGAPSDVLHVGGDSIVYTRVQITNAGGGGALTTSDGIRVIQVDGLSGGNFVLEGRAVAGAYDYALHKGGVIDPTDGDWYLRSEETSPPVDPEDPGAGGDGGPGTGNPVYRPEVGAYLANQMASMTMFRHNMSTRASDGFAGEDVAPRNVWVRARQHHLDSRVGADQVSSGTDVRDMEVGAELARWLLDDKYNVHLSIGAIYNQGRAESQEYSQASGYSAEGRLDARAFTLFATFANTPGARTGWYVDNWIQQADFDHRVQGQDLAPETSDSKRWTASIEGGYGFLLVKNERFDLVLQPQLQVLYYDFDAPSHVESNGTVVGASYPGGWSARGGVRLSSNIDRVLQPWVEVSAWDDQRDATATFNGTPVSMELSDLVYEINAGLNVGTGNGWSGWGSLGVQHGDHLRAAQGQLGVRYRW